VPEACPSVDGSWRSDAGSHGQSTTAREQVSPGQPCHALDSGRLPKLTVRVRFPSPAPPHDPAHPLEVPADGAHRYDRIICPGCTRSTMPDYSAGRFRGGKVAPSLASHPSHPITGTWCAWFSRAFSMTSALDRGPAPHDVIGRVVGGASTRGERGCEQGPLAIQEFLSMARPVWASNNATQPRTVSRWSAKRSASSWPRPAKSSRALWKMPREL
jgi:hypothetical protein